MFFKKKEKLFICLSLIKDIGNDEIAIKYD